MFWFAIKSSVVFLLIIYSIIPAAIKTSPWLVHHIVFVNLIRWPPLIDFDKPEDFGLNYTRNFYLKNGDVSLGVWHTLPVSLQFDRLEESDYEKSLSSGKTIILYYHGNSGTRAGWHRVQLYKKLSQFDIHIVAVDYRGYGNSNGTPTEVGVCSDAIKLYDWVATRAGPSPIFFWGHSLGTAITLEAASLLGQRGISPHGIILESPFTNLREAASKHPFTLPFRHIPGFSWFFLDALSENGVFFKNDENVAIVEPPILILHAKDDFIVPFDLGEKLYRTTLEKRNGSKTITRFVSFNESLRYGHKYIYSSPELENIIRGFTEEVVQKM